MYVLPADGVDRRLDTDGTLANSVATWQGWLRGQAGSRGLTLDTAHGALDLSFVRLRKTDAELAAAGPYVRDRIEDELRARGLLAATKIYAVYYDGRSNDACASGPWPPVLAGQVAAVYLNGLPDTAFPCRANPFSSPSVGPGYLEFSMVHELLHALGFAARCARHHTRGGHVSDSPEDLMYAGDEPWRPSLLDIGHDDYFGTGRTDCLDFAFSPFREGGPAPISMPMREHLLNALRRGIRVRCLGIGAGRCRVRATRGSTTLAYGSRRVTVGRSVLVVARPNDRGRTALRRALRRRRPIVLRVAVALPGVQPLLRREIALRP